MPVNVDIADRQYDYTDEEKAAEAVADFQQDTGLDDQEVLDLWAEERNPQRIELERRIFAAVDANGTAKRAQETVPSGITLAISET